jgi:hypothetical protein
MATRNGRISSAQTSAEEPEGVETAVIGTPAVVFDEPVEETTIVRIISGSDPRVVVGTGGVANAQ